MPASAQIKNTNVSSLAAIIANCWVDKDFQNELMADPKKILSEFSIEVGADAEISVLIDEPNLIHIVLADTPLEDKTRVAKLPEKPSFLQVYAYVYEKARNAKAFRHKLLAMPTETVHELGCDLPDSIHIAAYESTEHACYLVIPHEPQVSLSIAIQNEISMLSAEVTSPVANVNVLLRR